MKKSSVKITRYTSGKFYVDIVEKSNDWEAWIGHNSYGVSDLMFGIPKKGTDFDLFMELVLCNLPEYKAIYKDEYMR